MSLIKYTVFDTTTMLPKRTGGVQEHLLDSHIIRRLKAREGMLLGIAANLREERVVAPLSGAEPYLRRRTQAEIDAARARFPASGPDRLTVLMEALRAKGIAPSEAELHAAEARLRAS